MKSGTITEHQPHITVIVVVDDIIKDYTFDSNVYTYTVNRKMNDEDILSLVLDSFEDHMSDMKFIDAFILAVEVVEIIISKLQN